MGEDLLSRQMEENGQWLEARESLPFKEMRES